MTSDKYFRLTSFSYIIALQEPNASDLQEAYFKTGQFGYRKHETGSAYP